MRNKMNLKYIAGLVLVAVVVFATSCKDDHIEPARSGVTDIDGNVYETVVIGTQVWMLQNLKVSRYRNGDPIPNLSDNGEWFNSRTVGAYCNFENDESNGAIYGHLYNFAASTDSRNIAPEGWHVPSMDEWQTLLDYLGGRPLALGKMKETGTAHWVVANPADDNSSGFTALPGSYRGTFGGYALLGNSAYWLSSTALPWVGSRTSQVFFYISWDSHNGGLAQGPDDENLGMSVRCIKDN
jgi:uncharacterized protein (TIGR02145 family)